MEPYILKVVLIYPRTFLYRQLPPMTLSFMHHEADLLLQDMPRLALTQQGTVS